MTTTATLKDGKVQITGSTTIDKRTYVGFYHFRAAAPLQMVFEYQGNLPDAIERFQLHCKRCNYRFIKVRPFIVDLDEREQRINGLDTFNNFEGM